MSMSNGCLRRAFSCALFFFVLCAYPGFGQPARQPARKRQVKLAAPQFVPNRYIVFLQDPPVSARYTQREAMATVAAAGYQRQIVSRQQSLMTELASRNIRVTGSVNTLLNAVFVATGPDRLAEIRALPGVIGVMPERVMKLSLNKATALANAPAAWAQASIGGQSNAGAGIKIAILDTGIDKDHPAFQDSSLPKLAGFPKCNVQSDCDNFTNRKVIVARSYVPQIAAGGATTPNPATSSPDDYSARDRLGHGTAVASAAAAQQNTAGAIAFSGMAPKAYLGNYKIYGTPGVNDNPPESVWIQAIEDALNDGMDVANLSSGSAGAAYTGALDTTACGNPAGVPCDPLASAFEAAAKAGLVITVAAGNGGDDAYNTRGIYPYFNSIASPATAPSVIAVGATLNSHALGASVSVLKSNAPAGLQTIAAQRSDGCFGWDAVSEDCFFGPVSASPGLTAPLVDVTTLGDPGTACSALPANSLNGKFALIQRGPVASPCDSDTKAINATNAGAVGVIQYMADSSATIPPELLGYIFVPVVMISLSDGQALKSYIDANPNAPVRIDTAGLEQPITDFNQLISWSSLGPTPDGNIKPDIVATGGFDYQLGSIDPLSGFSPSYNGLYLATQSYDQSGGMYSATGYIGADGTSFAAPLVAGAAALVKQAHPGWTPGQIKSALLNYSAQDVATDDFADPVDVEWIGAGRLDANAAVGAIVTAEPAGDVRGGATLSFGFLKSGAALPAPIPVTITNTGSASVTLAVAVSTGFAAAGTTVSVNQSSMTLAAGAKTTLVVTLSGAVPAAGEYNGAITLKSATPAVNMRIPYMFIVGDGTVLNTNPVVTPFDYVNGVWVIYGGVGTDLGPVPIQVTDDYGAPVAGVSVTFAASPRGSVILRSATGTPGSSGNTGEAFTPLACSPASGASVVCPTNSYGIAWVDVVAGPAVTNSASMTASVPPTNTSGSTINLPFEVILIPVPTVTNSPSGGAPVEDAGAYGNTVAPGSYVAIFGANMMDPNSLLNPTGDVSFFSRLPLSLDDVTVSFDAPATGTLPAISVPGYVFFVSPSQINVYVPWELENYPSAQLKVTFEQFLYSNLVNVALKNYVPAFLMNSGTVADAVDNTTGALITTANPATAGEILQLYCNGLGPVSNQPASGDPASTSASTLSQTTTPVTVTIGAKSAQVFFAGLAPGFVGEYEVAIAVPAGLSSGNQPISVSVGGVTSPATVAGSPVYLPIK